MTLFMLNDINSAIDSKIIGFAAATWADIILLGLNDGEKPVILIDRSGSMTSEFLTFMGVSMSRMDVSRAILSALAKILSSRNSGFDLTQIPVKSWGTNVYDRHRIVTGSGAGQKFQEVVTTLDDFLVSNFTNNNPPIIDCTDGTDHSLWFGAASYPLVITDDFNKAGLQVFIDNYKKFSWCDGDNIMVIDNMGQFDRVHKTHQAIIEGQ